MAELVCWHCGYTLKDVAKPITRLARCLNCHSDLHVCRMCKFFNPGFRDHCDHDMAEPARELDLANFCHYYRPRANAFNDDKKSKSDAALQKLNEMFDNTGNETITPDELNKPKTLDRDSAKQKFDSLFKDPD